MAKLAIKSDNQQQLMLLPPSYEELVPLTHPVRVINSVIDRIDLKRIFSSYKGGGNSCFNPASMLKILIFAYLNNIHSCRKIEQQLKENVLYMWLSGCIRPDFRTLNYFRSKRLKDSFSDIFTQVVELLHEEGFVSLDVQYIDGTKIESMANKYTFVWRKSVEKNDEKLKEKTRIVLKQIEAQINFDENETESTDPLCVEDFQERLDKINKQIEKENTPKKIRKQIEKIQHENIAKMQTYKDQLAKMEGRNSYSKTDPEATFMRMKEDAMLNGQLKPGYNIQIATENQFITNFAVFQRPTDTMTLIPFLDSFKKRYNRQSKIAIADSGYGSEQNYEYMMDLEIIPYIKYNYFHKEQKRNHKNNPFLSANFYYNEKENYYICPMGQHMNFVRNEKRLSDAGFTSTVSIYKAQRCEGCFLRSICHKAKGNRVIEINHKLNKYREYVRDLLNTQEGYYHRSKRPVEPEAVFGQIKQNGMFRRFRLKGLKGAEIEFGLKALAHNMLKLAAKGGFLSFLKAFCVTVLFLNRYNSSLLGHLDKRGTIEDENEQLFDICVKKRGYLTFYC